MIDFPPFTRPPVIIGGCGRSGTTLLLAILGAHPSILAIPDETQAFCPTAYGSLGNGKPGSDPRGIDRERLYLERLAQLDREAAPDFARLKAYLARHIPGPSCRRWCEKTPKNVLFFGSILRAFEGRVRLIHLVRDGRDVITSVHPGRDRRFHVPPAQWITEVSEGLRFAEHKEVLTVRYEDLVLDFEPSLQRICAFLDEPFVDELRSWHHHTNVRWHDSWEGGTVRPLYTEVIGRWKQPQYADVIDRFLADPRARACLQRLGYA